MTWPSRRLPIRKPTLASGGKGEFAITAAAEKFIEDHRDRPFFCYVPHNNPHIPLAAAPELVEKHRDAFHPVYAAMIETLDDAVGRLMAKVESLGLADRTIFMFTSDNGGLHVLEFPGTPRDAQPAVSRRQGIPLRRWPARAAARSLAGRGRGRQHVRYAGRAHRPRPDAAGGGRHRRGENGRPAGRREHVETAPRRIAAGPHAVLALPELHESRRPPRRSDSRGGLEARRAISRMAASSYSTWRRTSGETKNLAAAEPARADELRGKLQAWRASVGARMPTPNPEFDAALHRRLYVDQDPSQLVAESTAAATEPQWKAWREAMNAAVKGRKPSVTPATGDIRLHAKDARIHGQTMRYEPQPNKNVLGYWTNAADWADWEFEVPTAGMYEVEIQQGCGKGSGGAEVAVEIGGQTLKFTVQDTGHFQHMILRTIGQVELAAGKHTLAVKPQTKPGVAVMDLRRVVLRPAP